MLQVWYEGKYISLFWGMWARVGFDTGLKYYFSYYMLHVWIKKKKVLSKYEVTVLKFDDCLTKWELFSESALGQSSASAFTRLFKVQI